MLPVCGTILAIFTTHFMGYGKIRPLYGRTNVTKTMEKNWQQTPFAVYVDIYSILYLFHTFYTSRLICSFKATHHDPGEPEYIVSKNKADFFCFACRFNGVRRKLT